jgi:hypothetical protein
MRYGGLCEKRGGGVLDRGMVFAALPRVRARLGELRALPRTSQTI